MKIKPKKMLAGGFLLGSKVIRNVMKVIGKDNAKVIAAKKSLSTTGKLDQLNLAQQKFERANIFSDTINAVVAKSKTFKNKNVKYGKALKEIASSHLKNKAEIRSAMFKKDFRRFTGKKDN
jgi:hypothetical protein